MKLLLLLINSYYYIEFNIYRITILVKLLTNNILTLNFILIYKKSSQINIAILLYLFILFYLYRFLENDL